MVGLVGALAEAYISGYGPERSKKTRGSHCANPLQDHKT